MVRVTDRPPPTPPEGAEDPDELAEATVDPLGGRGARPSARNALLKLLVLVVIVGGGFLAARYTPLRQYFSEEGLQQYFRQAETAAALERLREAWWAPLALVALYAVVGPTGAPISVVVLTGAVVFGPVFGSIYNVLGTFVGAVASFLVGRALGRDVIVHFAGGRLQRIERFLAHRGFWPLVRARFLPFPFVVVNYGAAMAGVPLGLFAAAAAVGLAPSVTVYTYFWASIWNAFTTGAQGGSRTQAVINLFVAISLLMMLSLVPNIVRRLRRARRNPSPTPHP